MEYIAYLHKNNKSDYGVSFPDFPGAVSAGKTLEEARQLAAEVLALHIHGMIEDGIPIPEPSTLDDLAGDAGMRGAVAFLVKAVVADALVRVNITARESQMEKIDSSAEAAGLTRSAFMVQAALRNGKHADACLTAGRNESMPPARRRSQLAKSSIRRNAAPKSANR